MTRRVVLEIDLRTATLPDAIAAMVEAWYEAQGVEESDDSKSEVMAPCVENDPWHEDVRSILAHRDMSSLPILLSDIYRSLGVSASGKTAKYSARIKAIAASIRWSYDSMYYKGAVRVGLWPSKMLDSRKAKRDPPI